MLVLGLDVGIRNLAVCALQNGVPVAWFNEALVEGRYEPHRTVEHVLAFVARHRELFAQAQHVVIERQLRANMRVIEGVLHALHWGKCSVVHARSVKARYGLSRRDYRQNKQAAVEFVARHAPDCELTDRFWRSRKRDDLADSYLLALFYSEQCAEQQQQCQSATSSRTTPPPGAPRAATAASPPRLPRRSVRSSEAACASPSSAQSTSRT